MTCGPRRSVKRVIELNVDVSDLITIRSMRLFGLVTQSRIRIYSTYIGVIQYLYQPYYKGCQKSYCLINGRPSDGKPAVLGPFSRWSLRVT